MTDVSIGIIQCDHVARPFAAIAGDYDDMVKALFTAQDLTFVNYDALGGNLPAEPRVCDGYIISGSSVSAYDDQPWIRSLEGFIRLASSDAVPIFGICFGLQVMATAMGGMVEQSEYGWGVGVRRMHLVVDRPWMDPRADSISLIMSHRDQVTELPASALVLGSSDHCANAMVEFTPRCVGIQGHPEFPADYARALYGSRRHTLGDQTDLAVVSLDDPTDGAMVGDWILRFLSDR